MRMSLRLVEFCLLNRTCIYCELCFSMNCSDDNLETIIKQEPPDPSIPMHGAKIMQHVPIKLEDLDGIGKSFNSIN